MKLASALLLATTLTAHAWVPQYSRSVATRLSSYIDQLGLYEEEEEEVDDSREATMLDKSKVANYGVGDWSSFVDFNEFDGGDGQVRMVDSL